MDLPSIKSLLVLIPGICICYFTFTKTDKYIKRVLLEHVIIHRHQKRLKRTISIATLDKQRDITDIVRALRNTGFEIIIHKIIHESLSLKLDFIYVALQLNQMKMTPKNVYWESLPDGVRLVSDVGHHDYCEK